MRLVCHEVFLLMWWNRGTAVMDSENLCVKCPYSHNQPNTGCYTNVFITCCTVMMFFSSTATVPWFFYTADFLVCKELVQENHVNS